MERAGPPGPARSGSSIFADVSVDAFATCAPTFKCDWIHARSGRWDLGAPPAAGACYPNSRLAISATWRP